MNTQTGIWEAHSADELLNGENPDYPCEETADCEGLLLDKDLVGKIGLKISEALNLD